MSGKTISRPAEAGIARGRINRDLSGTTGGFRQFLNWLDDGIDSNGEKYLEMRRRLVSYFDRKNCVSPDELADETLNRVAQRLEELGSITGTAPAQYCYVTARFVFLEYLRNPTRAGASLEEMSPAQADSALSTSTQSDNEAENKEHLSTCLDECLGKLASADRELILEYYRGEQRTKIENRRSLATGLRLTVNALTIRASRIRNKLELCVRECSVTRA
jgi:DNA-directed RNA polymerase specialized sigma24 family protein